jgi:flagellar hook-associated protein 2
LTISETDAGVSGQLLGLAVTQSAQNATFRIDGLAMQRRSNSVADALPGTTLTLKAGTAGLTQDIVIADDADKTKAGLQGVVDAWNAVTSLLQSELDIKPDTDRDKTLGGESAVRSLQRRMLSLASQAFGASAVRSLADLGVKTARDGVMSIDAAAFDRAMSSDPGALDRLLGDGLRDTVDGMTKAFSDTGGILKQRSKSLGDQKTRLSERQAQLESRLEAYRELLIGQFTRMEEAVSLSKSTGSFLSSQQPLDLSGGES